MSASVYDREYFLWRLREELNRARRYGRPFTLVFFDTPAQGDGRAARRRTDAALAPLAARTRASDVLCRVSANSLAVLLMESPGAGAREALARLREAVPPDDGWTVTVYVYPRDEQMIDDLASSQAA
jgi:GGDEF domain-containing protein